MRDFVHVADVARANVLALEAVATRETGSHTAYNICSGTPVTILEVAERITAGLAPSLSPIVTGEYRLGDVRDIVASPARARDEPASPRRCTPARGSRGSPPSRCATVPCLVTRVSTRRAAQSGPEGPGSECGPPRVGGSTTTEIASQGTKGSQIRSTSALLISGRSATATIATAATTRTGTATSDLRSRRQQASSSDSPDVEAGEHRRDRADDDRSGADRQRSEVCPQPVGRRALAGDVVRIALAQNGKGLPPGESCCGERDCDGEGGRDGNHQRQPPAGGPQDAKGEQREEEQPIGEEDAGSEQHARQGRPRRSPPGTGVPVLHRRGGQRRRPPGADRREHRVGGDGLQIAAGPITRNGRAMRAACSAPNARRATATARGVVAATATTTRPAAGPLASPTRARATKSRSAPGGCPATCTAQWSGWSNGMRSTKPRSVSGTFSTARAVGRYSVLWSRGRSSARSVHERERAARRRPAARPPRAGGATRAGRRPDAGQGCRPAPQVAAREGFPARCVGASRRAAAAPSPHAQMSPAWTGPQRQRPRRQVQRSSLVAPPRLTQRDVRHRAGPCAPRRPYPEADTRRVVRPTRTAVLHTLVRVRAQAAPSDA